MISLGLKMAGCTMVVFGAAGYGVWLAGCYKRRLKLLEQLRQMIFLLKGQIMYANAPLAEAFETVGSRTEGVLSSFFLQVAERAEGRQGDRFVQIWKEEVDKLAPQTVFSREDRQSLASMGEHLGFLDREMQERNLILYLEQLDMTIDELRLHKRDRCRVYASLGVMGGMFLAILLC